MDLRKTQLTEAEQMSTGMDNHTLSRKGINYDVEHLPVVKTPHPHVMNLPLQLSSGKWKL
jgi:hypothetical protein